MSSAASFATGGLFTQHRGGLDKSFEEETTSESGEESDETVTEEENPGQVLSDEDSLMHELPPVEEEIVMAEGGDGKNATGTRPKGTGPITIQKQDWDDQVAEITTLRQQLQHLQQAIQQAPGGAPAIPQAPAGTVSTEAKLDKYKGFTDERPAHVWWDRAASIAAQYRWSDARFIEACTNAMTGGAEEWVLLQKYNTNTLNSNILKNLNAFKETFLKHFDQKKNISTQQKIISDLRQTQNENVQTF